MYYWDKAQVAFLTQILSSTAIYIYGTAVSVSMFTCYYFLNFNTFITVLKNKF